MGIAEQDQGRADAVEDAVEAVHEHPVFENIARGGFIMSGLVHVLIGWLSLRMALGDSSGEASQSGALAAIAQAPGGNALLWIGGAAMVVLAVWHAAEAWFGLRWLQERRVRMKHVARTVGKSLVYGFLSVTALRHAAGARSSGTTQQMTAGVLESPLGRGLVLVAGAAVIGIGGYHVVKGLRRGFEDDLHATEDQRIGAAVVITGVSGYVAKGLALASVGVLLGWAAVRGAPEKAEGLDPALQAILGLPAGPVLLGTVGGGLILYGLYSVLRSRYAPM